VDTSGDGVVAEYAGAATKTAPVAVRQLPSLVFVLQHVDTDLLGPGPRVALLRALVGAEREGRVPKGASNLTLAPSPQPGEVVCKLTLSASRRSSRPAATSSRWPSRRAARAPGPSRSS